MSVLGDPLDGSFDEFHRSPCLCHRLSVQLSKQYPYVMPAFELLDVKGLTHDETLELGKLLRQRAKELAKTGAVMMVELVQVAEDFLYQHNRDPNMSAWEQMQAREAAKREEERMREEQLVALMSVDTQSPNGASPTTSTTRAFRDGSLMEGGARNSNAIERELLRQQEAFEAARRLRQGGSDLLRGSSISHETGDEADDDFDFDVDADDAGLALSSSSRYKSDFIELGVLGRGYVLMLFEPFFAYHSYLRRLEAVERLSRCGTDLTGGSMQSRKSF